MTISFGNGGEYGELWIQVFLEVHDRCNVAAAVAVVGSAPDSDDGLVFEVPLYVVLVLAGSILSEREEG